MATPTAMHHSHLALQTVVSTSVPEAQHTCLEQRLAQASLRRVEAKEFVFAEGDPTTHIFQVEMGAVALYKVLGDGRRQVVGFAYPGDLIGLGAEGEHAMNAQAIKPTRLRRPPVASLKPDRAVRPAGRASSSTKRWRASWPPPATSCSTTGQRSATERVVSFLLAFSRRNERNAQDPAPFDLPMTRGDIADFLGLTIETVSRTFTKLKVQGLIEPPQSSTVRITDLAGLRGLAGGEDVLLSQRRKFPLPAEGCGGATPHSDPRPGHGAAQHGGDAAGQVQLVLALYRDGAGVGLAVRAVVERAGPLVGAGLLGALHDHEADDRARCAWSRRGSCRRSSARRRP